MILKSIIKYASHLDPFKCCKMMSPHSNEPATWGNCVSRRHFLVADPGEAQGVMSSTHAKISRKKDASPPLPGRYICATAPTVKLTLFPTLFQSI